jgi:two-component system response regulator DctR
MQEPQIVEQQTVFVVDDDPDIRGSIEDLLDSVGLKSRVYSSANEFLDDFDNQQAGCLVLDIRMAPVSGLSLQEKLNEMGVSIPIIFVTGHGDVDVAVKALKAGAFDFIQKPFHVQSLLDCINSALEADLIKRSENDSRVIFSKKLETLTDREREVMQLLIEGNSNKMIAQQLSISPRTVEVHRQRVLQKFGIHTVSELIELSR